MIKLRVNEVIENRTAKYSVRFGFENNITCFIAIGTIVSCANCKLIKYGNCSRTISSSFISVKILHCSNQLA